MACFFGSYIPLFFAFFFLLSPVFPDRHCFYYLLHLKIRNSSSLGFAPRFISALPSCTKFLLKLHVGSVLIAGPFLTPTHFSSIILLRPSFFFWGIYLGFEVRPVEVVV